MDRLERLLFGHRKLILAAAALVTAALAAVGATRYAVNADFEQMIPTDHPFVRAWRRDAHALRGLGNTLHVAVENTGGSIYEPDYLEALRRITDELFLMPGVDRAWVRSLWMPAVRWTEVTEEGFRGGPVMPDDYDGSPASIERLRRNVASAGIAGALVARDGRSSLVFVPLLDRDPATGAKLDYGAFSARLESLRAEFEGPGSGGRIRVHIVGFAKLAGDLLDGMAVVAAGFAAAAAIATLAIFLHFRCVRSTALVVGCAAAALVWQLGIVSALRIPLDPFSVLVPFLLFALGVSHGAQRVNGMLQEVGRGTPRVAAARSAFRRLFGAGLTALLTDAVGFGVLLLVAVPAIRQMALTATIGVGVLVVTDLFLLPLLLAWVGVSPAAARRAARREDPARQAPWGWRRLERMTAAGPATLALLVAAAVTGAGLLESRRLPIGDVEPGAPELQPSSRYNRDDAFLAANYELTSDRFAVIVRTPPEGCLSYRTLVEADRLGWELRQLPGVRTTRSLADAVRQITAASFEGSPKWLTLSRDQAVLDYAAQQAVTRNPELFEIDGTVMPIVAYLSDHREETLDRVVRAAQGFAAAHSDAERSFVLAAGNAGFEAATHVVVREAMGKMTAAVYAAVILLCLVTLRSWRAVLVTVAPLAVTTVLCEALMVWLGIGVKLATLPVIALGVGIPDFALYLVSVQLAHQRAGVPLAEAWRRALRSTGRAVALVGVTLGAGVVTWAWSPIRLQSDMGLLLTFMFLGNMLTALVLVPALSRFLLPRAGRPASR
jgi:predicted RND superfamily exporter protein